MIWLEPSSQVDKHSLLSPSKGYWVNYDEDRMRQYYTNHRKAVLGTRIHELAAELIDLKIRLPNTTATLNMYVNDGIGYRMRTEQVLFYSENVFGTADSISFEDKELRIHDLKTGEHPASLLQLEIYAAIFCLQYKIKPGDISIVLRIYQNDEVLESRPSGKDIKSVMDKIVRHNSLIESMKGDF